jgi:hypothetical protein
MISVRDTLQTVKSSDVIALEQIEVAKAEQTALIAQVAEEKAILQENLDRAVQDAVDALQRVEDAKASFALQVEALKAATLSKKDALKAELATAADNIIASVPWENQWVIPHLEDARDRGQKVLDEVMKEHDGLINWIKPRPVDPERVKAVIARDLKTFADEQVTKE